MKTKQTGFMKKKRPGQSAKSVCFACRKCFHAHLERCVQCSGCIHMVGYFFTAPPRNDTKAWRLIEKMVVLAHYGFSGHGASGPMPQSFKEAHAIVSKKIRNLEPRLHPQRRRKNSQGALMVQCFGL